MSVEIDDELAGFQDANLEQPLGDVCGGCAELTIRVEKLERLLQRQENVQHDSFGTVPCFWTCVGLHAFATLFLFMRDETIVQYGYPFLLGAAGTLAVCHALAKRTIVEKFLRSTLTLAIVISAMMIALASNDSISFTDFIPLVAFLLPPMVVVAWLTAKSFAWGFGWSIAPPGRIGDPAKLKIRDLMIVTGVAAIGFALLRFASPTSFEDLGMPFSELFALELLPSLIATTCAVLFAFVILSPRRINVGYLFAVFVFLSIASPFIFGGVFYLFFDSEFWEMTSLTVPFVIIGMASPLFTFLLMRRAGYRFETRRGLAVPASDES